MRRGCALALALLAALAASSAAAGEGAPPKQGGEHSAKGAPAAPPPPLELPPHPISDLMGELQQAQVRMANGDKTAYAKQNDKLRAIGDAILAAKPEIWKSKEETDAAAAYVLSGGQPRVISKLLETGGVPKSEDPLLRGALAYAAGRSLDAQTLLADIDPKTVSLRLGSQLAYAKSVLATSKEPDQAIQFLDLARLLAPGSLVEEAALRREILLAGDRRDSDRMIFLARQYASRFPKSIFADNFISSLSSISLRYRLIDDVGNLRKFETLLGLVSQEQRRSFLLAIARDQTVNGKFEVAGEAADYVLSGLPAGDPDEPRARFYLAAAKILGDDYDAGLAQLKTLDRSKLGKPDQALLAAALQIAHHLRDTPSDAEFAEADYEDRIAAARSPDPTPPNPNDPVAMTLDRGASTVESAQALIRLSRKPL